MPSVCTMTNICLLNAVSFCFALSTVLGALLQGCELLLGLFGSFVKFSGAVFHSLGVVLVL